MIKFQKQYIFSGLWILFFCSLDIASKFMILNIFQNSPYPYSESISVIGDLFKLTYVRNYGISFGIFNNVSSIYNSILITLTSSTALAVLFYFNRNLNKFILSPVLKVGKFALLMIFGGALGNITDRIIHGYVVDFLDFGIKSYRWYTFNIADIFIVSGCILLSILMVFFENKNIKATN